MSQLHEVVIIGGGIAAHTAALYAARASLNPVVISGIEPDQLSLTTLVENFPGFPEGILGPQLILNAKQQAQKFGAEYRPEVGKTFEQNNDGTYTITTDKQAYQSRTVIIATGASARWLNVKGESGYIGKGVSTCATCDAAFYRGKTVAVVGGGDSAMEEALVLYKMASNITIIHRRDEFRASQIMQDRVLALTDKITVIWNSEVVEVLGNGSVVTGVKIKNVKTNEESELTLDGVFLAIGHDTNTKIFTELVATDTQGYIITDKKSRTNLPGVFAAGDCQDPVFKQAITSAGSGATAAISAESYLEEKKASGQY